MFSPMETRWYKSTAQDRGVSPAPSFQMLTAKFPTKRNRGWCLNSREFPSKNRELPTTTGNLAADEYFGHTGSPFASLNLYFFFTWTELSSSWEDAITGDCPDRNAEADC